MEFKKKLINFIKDYYQSSEKIFLHEPIFKGNEKKYLMDTIDSTFVSSVGQFVNEFEDKITKYTKASASVAVVNGTSAIHLALYLCKIKKNDLVITPSFTFIAICNVLSHLGAEPIFIDIERKNLGICPEALNNFLEEFAFINDEGVCVHKKTNKKIKAIVPMNAFGHPVKFDEIQRISKKWKLKIIEDGAESLGSQYKGKKCGALSDIGILSFNGNKIITTGGGGMLLFKDKKQANFAKHLSSTARIPNTEKFVHDEVAFNFRMPNLNAALGLAQFENIENYLSKKRNLASEYRNLFKGSDYLFVDEVESNKSNFWLNTIICENKKERDKLIKFSNDYDIATRPGWELMSDLPMFSDSIQDNLVNSRWIQDRLVNLPSSVKY